MERLRHERCKDRCPQGREAERAKVTGPRPGLHRQAKVAGAARDGAGRCFTLRWCSRGGCWQGLQGTPGGLGGVKKQGRLEGLTPGASPRQQGACPGGGDAGSSGPRLLGLGERGGQGSSRDTHPERGGGWGGQEQAQRDQAAAVRQKRGPSQLARTPGRCPRGRDLEGQVSSR